ncbi:MAG: hypothetical protein E6G01_09830 [Actinobacteria bacterium]|nr:MAG: hypothetical protein E6G01_09830 [Actinomycetota bacterium]
MAVTRSAAPLTGLLPRPGARSGSIVADAPGDGPGYWAGGPSAVWVDGTIWLAYRLRRPVDAGRGYANVVARSEDGEHFETVAVVTSEELSCASLERPALVPMSDGTWRLYVSCSTPGTLHWQVDLLEASDPAGLPSGRRTTVLAGDRTTAWKDPVIWCRDGAWQMWVCRHRTDVPADGDRMDTWYATSSDGVAWTLEGLALHGRAGRWDERGARITAVVPVDGGYAAYYDGRPTADDNWAEQTGVAFGTGPSLFEPLGDEPWATPRGGAGALRYLSLVPLPHGGQRVYYEMARPDGPHDLRTEYVPRPGLASQSS